MSYEKPGHVSGFFVSAKYQHANGLNPRGLWPVPVGRLLGYEFITPAGIDMGRKVYNIRAVWDAEAEVYVATSDDVPGLVTEAATKRELEQKLRVLVPELLELNGVVRAGDQRIPLHLVTERSKDFTIPATG